MNEEWQDGSLTPRLDGGALVLACPNGRSGEIAQQFTPDEARQLVFALREMVERARRAGDRAEVGLQITDGRTVSKHYLLPDEAERLAALVSRLLGRQEQGARDLRPLARIGRGA